MVQRQEENTEITREMESNKGLVDRAKEMLTYAYAPYSKFRVGAALLGKSGKIYTGCNIENSSYGACLCAERTAIAKGVSQGETEFLKIAVVSSEGGFTYPCGICRQVLWEFMPDGIVIVEDSKQGIIVEQVKALLPNGFSLLS